MSRYRYLVFGVGQTGQLACRMLMAAGAHIAAVYSRSSHLGKDVGTLLGGAPIGLTVQSVSTFDPRNAQADVALFFTTSFIGDLMGDAKRCLAAGLRVLTIAEDAAYPWSHAPDLAAELDAVAKQAGSALLSSGMNDVPMVYLPLGLAAMSSAVQRITSLSIGNFGRLGEATLNHMGIGGTVEDFQRIVSTSPAGGEPVSASIALSVGQAMAAAMGVAVRGTEVKLTPLLATRPLPVPSLGRTLPAGWVRGIREVAELQTQGPTLVVELQGLIFDEGDEERCSALVDGWPTLSASLQPCWPAAQAERSGDLPGFSEATVAIALNRIPALMAAPPGLLSVDRLAGARYWPGL